MEMIKKTLVFIVFSGLYSALFSQQLPPLWQLREPTNGAGIPTNIFTPSLLLDSLQNVIVLCDTYEPGLATGFTTIKYDPDGHKLWERSVQTFARDFVEWGVTDRDGAIYVAGQSLQNPVTGTPDNQMIFKYGPNGDTLWLQYFHLDSSNVETYVQQLMLDQDQNLMVFGSWRNPATGFTGLFIRKESSDGAVIWTDTIIENQYGFVFDHAVWTGNRWVLWGRNASSAIGGTRLLSWQVDPNGHTISAHFSDLNPELFAPLYIDREGNAFFAKGLEHKLIKYDTTATFDWIFQIPSATETPLSKIYAVTSDSQNNIYATGRIPDSINFWRTYTTKLDQSGTVLWQDEINDGRTLLDRFLWISDTILLATGFYFTEPDSNYYDCSFAIFDKEGKVKLANSDLNGRRNIIYGNILNGSNLYSTGGSYDDNFYNDIDRQFLAKYSLNALVNTDEPANPSGSMSVWPNPFVDHAGLHILREGPPEKGRLTVRDMSGRLVSVQELLVGSSGQTIALKDLGNAPPGVYSVMLAVGNEWYEARAVKMR